VVPAKNRNKLVMEFQIDAHRGGEPSTPGNEDIVTVYREPLEIHQPKNIGMFGSSGGCTLARPRSAGSRSRSSPARRRGTEHLLGRIEPGRCAVDPERSGRATIQRFLGQPPFGGRNTTPRKPSEPPATALDGDIPKATRPLFCLAALATCD